MSIGKACAVHQSATGSTSTERRFINLLDADTDQLLHRLRQMIALLKDQPIDFDALPLKDAFTIVRGNGKRKLAVFEDPNCGYCKRFERDLAGLKDVTIYTFLMPIPSLHPEARGKAKFPENFPGSVSA